MLLEIDVKIRIAEEYQKTIVNKMFTLGLVSCGRTRLDSLAFGELVSVFQWQVWHFLFATLIILLLFKLVITDSSKKKDFPHVFMDFLDYAKILVEQGGTFLERRNLSVIRFVVGLHLLLHILISNGYRNTNVYNMVKPRVSIPYQTFNQLIEDNKYSREMLRT